jgi:peptidyl-Lys metalloendopeptidase
MDRRQGERRDPNSLHNYIYCHADPSDRVDPTGYADIGFAGFAPDIVTPQGWPATPEIVAYAYRQDTGIACFGFSPSEEEQLRAAVKIAMQMASEAVESMKDVTYDNVTGRYVRWFGERDEYRIKAVKRVWDRVEAALKYDFLKFEAHQPRYFTSDRNYMGNSIIDSRNMFCLRVGDGSEGFWTAPLRGEDSKAGTIIHEISHMYASTHDHAYGTIDCKHLAVDEPKKAVDNADSYEFFAEFGK